MGCPQTRRYARIGSLLTRATALFALLCSDTAQATQWVEFGPNPIKARREMGGRMVSLALHPNKPDVLYAGAASGGLWRWDNSSWTPLTDHMPVASIGAIAIDPKDPDTIYAGTGESTYSSASFYGLGIFKSTDGGESWKHYGEKTLGGRSVHQLAISPKTGHILLALAETGEAKEHPQRKEPGGLFISKDKGKSWERVSGIPKWDATDVVFAPDDPDTIYAALSSPQNGKGSPHAGLYRSTDGGKSWEKRPGLPKDPRKIVLAVSPADPDRLYALGGGTSPSLYVSRDRGKSFSRKSVRGLRAQINGHYDICVAADPTNADRVFTGGIQVYVSTNGGDSSRRVTPPHPDIQRLLIDDSGSLYCAQDGGIHISKDGGSRWTTRNKGLGTVQIYPGGALNSADPQKMVGGLQDNGTVYRSGKSNVWNESLGGDGGCNASHPETPNVVFSGYYGAGNLYKSTNGGRSYSLSSSGISKSDRVSFLPPFVYHPKDPKVLFYGTQRMYKSTNQGRSWKAISSSIAGAGKAIRSIAISPDGEWLYVVTGDETVQVSKDGGKNFKKVLSNVHGPRTLSKQISVAPWDRKVAFLGVWSFETDPIRMTKDGGETWTSILGNLRKAPVNTTAAVQSGENKIVLAGTDAGIFANCNLDGHWRSVGEFFPTTPVADVQYDAKYQRLVAFTFGRGAWVLPEVNDSFWSTLCSESAPEPEPDPSTDSSESSSNNSPEPGPTGESDSADATDSSGKESGSADSSGKSPGPDGPSGGDDSNQPSAEPTVDGGDSASCSCSSAAPFGGWLCLLPGLSLLARRRRARASGAAAAALALCGLAASPALAAEPDLRAGLSFDRQQRSQGLSFSLGTTLALSLDRPQGLSWTQASPGFQGVQLQRFVVQNPDSSQDTVSSELRSSSPTLSYPLSLVGSHVLLFCTEESRKSPLLERYVYCNKTVIRVSDGEGRVGSIGPSVAGKAGEPVEIRALMSPDRIEVGSGLPVRVYMDNQHPVGDEILVIAPDQSARKIKIYDKGIAHVPVDQAGTWIIRYEGQSGNTHYVGDLVFEVL